MTPRDNDPSDPPRPPPVARGILGDFGSREWRAERMFDDRIAMLKRAIPARIVGDFDPDLPQ